MNALISDSINSASSYAGQFQQVAFYGRTLAEYSAFFDLHPTRDLAGCSVLDCSAGAASFAAEVCTQCARVVAVDPLYGRTPAALAVLGKSDIFRVLRVARVHPEKFDFSFYRDFHSVERHRRAALEGFLRDYPGGLPNGRYVRAALPNLPFPDGAFDLALNSHFLFLYATRFGEDFLSKALRELLRVAREVRIFPLVTLEGRDYSAEPEYLQQLVGGRIKLEFYPVRFRFFQGAGTMLRLTRRS